MTEIYANLGKNIVLDAIIRASDVNDIEDCIVRELNRRSQSSSTVKAVADTPINDSILDSIDANCKTGGYTGEAPSKGVMSASQMQKYISFIKELYRRIIVS